MDPLGVSQIGLPSSSQPQKEPEEAPATPAKDYSPQHELEPGPLSSPWARTSPQRPDQPKPAVHLPQTENAWSPERPAFGTQQEQQVRSASREVHGPISPSPWSAASGQSLFSHQSQRAPLTPSKEPRSPFSEDAAHSHSATREAFGNPSSSPQRPPNQQYQSERSRHAGLQGHEAAEALKERDRKHGFVKIRIQGVDRAKKDFSVKLEAQTNLSSFHHGHIRPFSRALNEFVALHTALAANHPHLVLPALPLPATSASTDEEEDRLLKMSFQKWCDRITKHYDLSRDEELRNFLEASFGYQPTTLKRRLKAPSSSFGLPLSRSKARTDDDLSLIQTDMVKLEAQYGDTGRAIDKDGRSRKLFSGSLLELSEQFGSFAVTETHAPLQTGFRKIGEGIRRQAEIQSGFATAECVTLADALMYAANEAKEAKDALVQRQLILDEHRSAERSALSKQRALEKLRNSGSIKQDRVTETLEEYEAAAKHEKNLAQRLQAVSTELQPSVIEHAKTMHEDLFSALLVHSKAGVTYETQALKDLEALRSDIQKIPPKRTEDVYVIQHQSNPSTRSPVPHSAPPNASSYPTSPPAHGRRSSVETGRPSSAGLPSSPGRSFSGVSSPPPGSTVHAQSMFVPPSHKPPSQGQAGRINDLARSVVLVPGHEGASSSAGGNGGSRRIRDDRHRVDAKTAASKLSTMFNN